RSEDENGDVGFGGGADPLEDDQHLLVAADHLAEALNRRRLILGGDGSAALEEVIELVGEVFVYGTIGRIRLRSSVHEARDAEVDELADAVFNVETQASERLHQRFDVEALLGARIEVAQNPRTQRRLHKCAEPRIEVGALGGAHWGGSAGATRTEGQIVHPSRLTLSAGRAWEDRVGGC